MARPTPQDIAAWLRHVHGGDWQAQDIEGPYAVASGLNDAVRRAAAGLPLEREPPAFHQLFLNLAEKKKKGG